MTRPAVTRSRSLAVNVAIAVGSIRRSAAQGRPALTLAYRSPAPLTPDLQSRPSTMLRLVRSRVRSPLSLRASMATKATLPSGLTTAAAAAASEFDYVIVGGGSAGCVLANRLSADPTNRVLLVEAGPPDRGLWDSWRIQAPAGVMFNLKDARYNWRYTTEPQTHLDGRRLSWPRGRVLGGSSSINAMVYMRGHAHDYDGWASEHGATGWSYAECLPYFRRSQTHELGGDSYRGGDGPLRVIRGRQHERQELHGAFIEAAKQAGYPFTDDMNGFQQEGVGHMDMTVHDGKRWSSASAYLHPALAEGRPNLAVVTGALAHRVLFDEGGRRAIGVSAEDSASRSIVTFRAAKEVTSAFMNGSKLNRQLTLFYFVPGHSVWWCRQLAATAAALWRGRRRTPQGRRSTCGAPSSCCGSPPGGPHRHLRQVQVHAADHTRTRHAVGSVGLCDSVWCIDCDSRGVCCSARDAGGIRSRWPPSASSGSRATPDQARPRTSKSPPSFAGMVASMLSGVVDLGHR